MTFNLVCLRIRLCKQSTVIFLVRNFGCQQMLRLVWRRFSFIIFLEVLDEILPGEGNIGIDIAKHANFLFTCHRVTYFWPRFGLLGIFIVKSLMEEEAWLIECFLAWLESIYWFFPHQISCMKLRFHVSTFKGVVFIICWKKVHL